MGTSTWTFVLCEADIWPRTPNFIHKSRYITCNFKGCVYILGCMCKNHVMLTFNKVDGIY